MSAPKRWSELATANDTAGSFWIAALRREEDKVNAACRALGGLEFFIGPEFTGTSRDRMRHIREVVAELRAELGMPHDPLDPTREMPDSALGGEAA
jgi:hypothetical protein